MPSATLLSKDRVAQIANNIRTNVPLNVDYIYEVYEMANEAIDILKEQTTQIEVKEVSQFDLLLYCIGEYYYSISHLKKEEIETFHKNEDYPSSMASVAADKYLSLSMFNHVEKKLANRFLPPASSLNMYLNFMLNIVKEYKKNYIKMGENDILVIEGLHCLNEQLTSSIPRKNKYKIFIAPFAQLNIDNHNRIHTSDTRRLRRIIRDNRTRGRSAADTLRMWSSIRSGEFKWIYPYQNDADDVINSALTYELGVLKTYAEPLLYSVDEEDEMYPEAIRLINILRNVLPIPSDDIPSDSVIREFIGGSGFYDI